MRIDRKKFTEAVEYIRLVNSISFDELDFSEFFNTDSDEFRECAREFKYFGLSNKDFIGMYSNLIKEATIEKEEKT
jgi:hypothetical protein